MSSKANVTHPERQRQDAWVLGPAAVPPGCVTMGKLHDFKNKCSRTAQDGCAFCLWRTGLVIGQPQVPSLASADSHCVLKLVTLWPQYPHLRKGTSCPQGLGE